MHTTTLPYELLQIIFKLSASQDTRAACKFARISRVVKTWMDPIIYQTLFITGATKSKQVEYTLSHRDPIPLQRMIKTFIRGIPYGDSEAQLESYLIPALSGITRLSYVCTTKSSHTIIRLLTNCQALRHLAISFPSAEAARRLLPSLGSEHATHLSLHISGSYTASLYTENSNWAGLSRRFPNLQCLYLHGCTKNKLTLELFEGIVQSFEPRLRRFVLDVSETLASYDSEWGVLKRIRTITASEPKLVDVVSSPQGHIKESILRENGVSYIKPRSGDWLHEKILELDFWDVTEVE